MGSWVVGLWVYGFRVYGLMGLRFMGSIRVLAGADGVRRGFCKGHFQGSTRVLQGVVWVYRFRVFKGVGLIRRREMEMSVVPKANLDHQRPSRHCKSQLHALSHSLASVLGFLGTGI